MAFINTLETPAIIAKVIKIPTVNTKPLKASFNNQNANKKIKRMMAAKVNSRAFLGFTKFSSVPLKTSNGDTYQVLDRETDEQLHQGSLSDCEAWIRLQEGGYF